MRSVIKPGRTRRIPPSTAAKPGVSKWIARSPSRAKAARRDRDRRVPPRSNSTPATEVPKKSTIVSNQPISDTSRNASSSAAGREQADKRPFYQGHQSNSRGLVGVTIGIVYGRPEAAICFCSLRLWIRSAACLDSSGEPDFSADFPLRRRPRRTRVRRHDCKSVQDVFDIYTIIFLALAVFIFLRLRSVLGQRTGRERPPYDPYSARDAVRGGDQRQCRDLAGAHRRECRAQAGRDRRTGGALERYCRTGLGHCRRARRRRAGGPAFDVKHFIAGARAAYEMIVTGLRGGRPAHAQESARARSL